MNLSENLRTYKRTSLSLNAILLKDAAEFES